MASCTRIVDDREVLTQYEYDSLGNVVNQKETIKNRFKFNGQYSVEKENEWTIYIRGSEILASSRDYAKTYYRYANDEMASCTRIVDDREVLTQYEYDSLGNVVNQKETIKNRFKFNGQYSPTKICWANAKRLSFALAKSDESSPTKICGANAKHLSFALAKINLYMMMKTR